MTNPVCVDEKEWEVDSMSTDFGKEFIQSKYLYQTTRCYKSEGVLKVKPVQQLYMFKTQRNVPKTGVMIVGLGGNNGTTVLGGILSNKYKLNWETKNGILKPNYYGSITQSSTTPLGLNENNERVYCKLNNILPMLNPNNIIIGGWDINNMSMDKAMKRANVFHINLQKKLIPYMKQYKPLPSIYYPDFIALNQKDRANNIINGDKPSEKHLQIIRNDIKNFKKNNNLDKVIIIWSANTERYSEVIKGVHDTEINLLKSIKAGNAEIAPSQMFAIASILEGCSYINGSPQNTFCPGIIKMANKYGVFIGGDDFKSGQTKIKSVLADFLVSSGLKLESIVSYNHLGNNDGKNLSSYKQFRSKEISKSNVVDDMVNSSNGVLYKKNEKPDHCVVIKYVPYVGDSKRAMDEYTSRIFMHGENTIVLHNTCEDSLLAAPIILDLIVLTELFERIQWKLADNIQGKYNNFGSVLTILSFLLKAPLVPDNSPLINALFTQKCCIENILRACIGLPPINNMFLENKTKMIKVIDSETDNDENHESKEYYSENDDNIDDNSDGNIDDDIDENANNVY